MLNTKGNVETSILCTLGDDTGHEKRREQKKIYCNSHVPSISKRLASVYSSMGSGFKENVSLQVWFENLLKMKHFQNFSYSNLNIFSNVLSSALSLYSAWSCWCHRMCQLINSTTDHPLKLQNYLPILQTLDIPAITAVHKAYRRANTTNPLQFNWLPKRIQLVKQL